MQPLFFRPIMKRIVWGGRRLGDLLGKPIGDGDDYAESWEVVDHGDCHSEVSGGVYGGLTLRQLLCDENEALLGRYAGLQRFPLLLKYLDCNRVLSVQVHPNDDYASKLPCPDLGKTEAWYIVDAAAGSKIYAGLKSGVDRPALEQAIRSGRTEEALHVIEPRVGQCIFIPAGTVHALGGGLVVAEIQQSSDTTFRLFDWNRVGADGQSRPLHIDQSLDVTDYSIGPIEPQVPQSDPDGLKTLVQCDKFVLRQADLNPAAPHAQTVFVGGDHAPHIMTVVRGSVTIDDSDGYQATATVGQSALIPAASPRLRFNSQEPAVVLFAELPAELPAESQAAPR